ncbi:MAG: type VII toxin-antitoxin system HepT family RNase toxin [Roseiflexus sp.]
MNALKSLQGLTYEEFAREHVLHAAAERDFQVAIQAALDIGSIILAEQSVSPVESYKDVFLKLSQIGVLPQDFAVKMVRMAQFRNVLVHLYLEVDLQKVYHYLQHHLDDLEMFTRYVGEYLRERQTGK